MTTTTTDRNEVSTDVLTRARENKWAHRPGDGYVPLCWYPQGRPAQHRHEVVWAGSMQQSRSAAFRRGIKALDHDDFNTAVMRGDHVVAMLWNGEHLDYDEDELDRIRVGLAAWGYPRACPNDARQS